MASSSMNTSTVAIKTTSTQSTSLSTSWTSTADEAILTATKKPSVPPTTLIPSSKPFPTQSPTEVTVASAAAVISKPSGLTSAQIGGIAAASSVSASFAVFAILFLICLRRKKRVQHKTEKMPFDIKRAPMTPPLHKGPRAPPSKGKDPRGGVGGVGITQYKRCSETQAPLVPPKTGRKRRSLWPTKYEKPEDIGVAMSPEVLPETSPNSIASHRTNSRLLPDKPTFGLLPPMQAHAVGSRRPESAATEFEEDLEEGSLDAARIAELYSGHWPAHRDDWNRRPAENPSGSAPRALLPAPVLKPSGDDTRRPELSVRLPTSLTPGGKMRGTMYLAPAPTLEASGPSSIVSVEKNPVLHPHVYTSTTQNATNNLQRHSSITSETSFETSGELTPENENNPLSPITESPQRPSRAHVRYPVIPGSSSTTARRMPSARKIDVHPPQHNKNPNLPLPPPPQSRGRNPNITPLDHAQPRCQSPSSLLAKRRGDRAAAELEMKLRLRKNELDQKKQNQALKIPKDHSAETQGPKMNVQGMDLIKSPTGVWVPRPKLTPTRRGEELYLSVQ